MQPGTPCPTLLDVKRVSDEEGLRWLSHVMSEIRAIKIGDTRRRLLEAFEPDGGFAPIPNPRFVHRRFPIKVEVRFSPAAKQKKGKLSEIESDDDLIVSISRPYFEAKTMD